MTNQKELDFHAKYQRILTSITVPFQILADGFLRAGKATHEGFYRAYIQSGAPYGETQGGFIQWLDSLDQSAKTEMTPPPVRPDNR